MSEARQRLVEEAQRTIAAGSKSFRFASQIFDLKTRERSWLLYAWCRACDDITDGQTLGHDAVPVDEPLERIAFLRARTDAALAGQPTGLVPFDALATVAIETRIPSDLPHDHLAGFARDAAGWTPTNEQDLLSYCYQVAGAVGVMMAHVMGVDPGASDPLARDTLDRAADLGIAFQLANITRDIVDDAKVGRSYIPTDWTGNLDPLDPAQRDRLTARTDGRAGVDPGFHALDPPRPFAHHAHDVAVDVKRGRRVEGAIAIARSFAATDDDVRRIRRAARLKVDLTLDQRGKVWRGTTRGKDKPQHRHLDGRNGQGAKVA